MDYLLVAFIRIIPSPDDSMYGFPVQTRGRGSLIGG
jgi:hypothetical protein